MRHSTHSALSTPDILDNLQVDVLTDTDVLSISYDSPSPATAATMANAFAQTYLKYRTDQAVSRLTDAGQSVRAEQDQIPGAEVRQMALQDVKHDDPDDRSFDGADPADDDDKNHVSGPIQH